ncbi:MAG: YggT family protein [Thermosulfidibacteraceae bacterium]|jgi:YggT family protein
MYVLSYFIGGVAKIISFLLNLYTWIIIIRVILSWIGIDPWHPHPFVRFVYAVTEPVLRPVRRLIKPIGYLDLSPLIVLILIYFLQLWLVPVLMRLSIELSS